MKKPIIITLSAVALLVVIVLIAGVYKFNFTNSGDILPVATTTPVITASDVKNISYVIDGETFALKNGSASHDTAPGSATKNTLQIFGEPVYSDLNGDGVKDAALMLVNNPGGSGSFFYAVLAISKNGVYTATNALLLGDRIAPQNINIENGRAVYNYAERKAGEPMTVQPSIGKSLYVQYDKATGQIGEWVKGFEGEANPSMMKLDMKKWEWVKTTMNDGTVTVPKKSGVFTLTFETNGKVNVGTDCNSMAGSYTVKGSALNFGGMMSTKMYCEGSQEDAFAKSLGDISSYLFTSKGELILEVKMDSGTMTFR